ncbi:MAG: Tannase and feruloyl esterase [Rhizobacter sp.]|nr:Tannase and feruloyl esterase [Rhizobacter sp.]
MTQASHFPFTRTLPARLTTAAIALLATVSLGACGGDDDDGGTATALAQTPATCTALLGTTVAASAIGEASTGAVVTAATYQVASPDTLNTAGTAIIQGTPDYCQLLVDIKPVDTTAPTIKAEVNLPTIWNGKKLQFGGAGYNGTLVTGLDVSRNAGPEVSLPITQGYMTAGTDSGHQTQANVEVQAFALNDEALVNMGYASYKKTNDVAIQLGLAYYGKKPTRSYYMGGSEGGREGMMMAQRYPADYDGIVVLDPVMNWSGLQTFGNYAGGILQSRPAAWLGGKIQLVHNTVVAACDALDGIADNVVSNYKNCKTPADAAIAALRCASGTDEGATCLSTAQLAVVNGLHAGYTFTFPLANGMTSYAGFGYGGEGLPGNWSSWTVGTVAPTFTVAPNIAGINNIFSFGNGYVRYFIAKNKDFNPLTYDPTVYQARVQAVSAIMDATNPDLTAFFARGGKMILKEDMADNAQSPYTGLNYWDAVVAKLGRSTVEASFVAYANPGLSHTSNGFPAGTVNAPTYGIPGRIDLLGALVSWVENGTKPADQLTIAAPSALPPYTVTAAKALCRYPNYPRYVGTSPAGGNVASNYVCTAS